MSKITFEPNASGTGVFTIASPNSNTDRTLNLPDEAGDFVLSASGVISNFTSTGIDDNATSTAITIDASGHAIIPAGVTLGTSTGVYNVANTLDDYEEGTWTPSLTNGGNVLFITANYTKVGKLVTVSGSFRGNSVPNNSSTVLIGGLPFASSGSFSYSPVYVARGFPNISKSISIQPTGSSLQFWALPHNSSSGSPTQLGNSELYGFINDFDIAFFVSYYTT